MNSGIYAYWDNEKGYYAYVGKDSHIDKNHRHNVHKAPSFYDDQPFNRILQNNPDRYEYRILIKGDYNNKQLNKMEKFCIKHLKTYHYDYPDKSVFNFTKGGDGCNYWEGKTFSDEHKQKISESLKGENNPNYGKTFSDEHKRKISESKTYDYPRIIKIGMHGKKQGYAIKYNGKRIKSSVYIEKLEEWFKENYPNEELIKEGKY